jgi:hypothetical protein
MVIVYSYSADQELSLLYGTNMVNSVHRGPSVYTLIEDDCLLSCYVM